MFLKMYSIAISVFFVIDMIWLGLIAKPFYSKHLGFLMKSEINWWAALLFYFIFIAGLVTFVLTPALKANAWQYALMYGAFFGLITYATYDLTNLATIKDWPLIITIVDLLWGTILAALVSVISFFVISKI